MSFTSEVRDEFSRVAPECNECERAQLSALIRVCGTLSFHGSGSYSIRIATETGAVARTVISLTHKLFDLKTPLTVRRSVLHKSRNYLIEMPEQPGLDEALVALGIISPGRGLVGGVAHDLVARPCCARAYLRGVFMAGGFIADPRGDFHLEFCVTGEAYAHDIAHLLANLGVSARINRRRGAYAVYLKSFEDIVQVLTALGAQRAAKAVEATRRMKTLKSDVNRRVNAEIANQARAGGAAAEQLVLIDQVEAHYNLEELPAALREFCELRRAFPDMSLAELGQQCTPPLSKSALYHRVLRLQALLNEAASDASDADEAAS